MQARPGAIDHKPEQELVILPAPGEVLLFSGAQLHASTPNTSGLARYSVDFRTVYVPDLLAGRGAPLVDVALHRHRDPGLRQRRRREQLRRGDRGEAVRRAAGRRDAGIRQPGDEGLS